jgi:hypothetical protein
MGFGFWFVTLKPGSHPTDAETETSPPLQIAGSPAIAPHLSKMYGIRNGIDQDIWDPSADEFLSMQVGGGWGSGLVMKGAGLGGEVSDSGGIAVGSERASHSHCYQSTNPNKLNRPQPNALFPQYGPDTFVEGKAAARRELRSRMGLADVDVPIVSVVTRLVHQKVFWCLGGDWGGKGCCFDGVDMG